MIGRTNINGTNDASGVCAVLSIDAPTGSTVTVSKSGFSKTLKNSIIINYRFSRYFYLVPISKFGTWTVTAVLGSDTASDTVNINTLTQYNIKLSYWNGELFDAGDEYTAITGGWESIGNTVKQISDGKLIVASSGSDYVVATANKIELGEWSTLRAIGKAPSGSSYPNSYRIFAFTDNSSMTQIDNTTEAYAVLPTTESETSVNIQSLFGVYYIGIKSINSTVGNTYITKAWFT